MPRDGLGHSGPYAVWRSVAVPPPKEQASTGPWPSGEDRSGRMPASPRGYLGVAFILDMLSIFVGIIAAMLMMFASIPFIATADWLIAPIALVGVALGVASGGAGGRNFNLILLLIHAMIVAAAA